MSTETPSSGWLKNLISILAILLSIASFIISFYNYRDNTTERILVRMSTLRRQDEDKLEPRGQLFVEVTNIGFHSIYLKRVEVKTAPSEPSDLGSKSEGRFIVFEHDPVKPSEPTRPLQPSESTDFTKDWDLAAHPLVGGIEDVELRVETTKQEFHFSHQPVRQGATKTFTLTVVDPSKKQEPRRGTKQQQ